MSKRRLDCDDATGDGGAEPPVSDDVRPSRRDVYVDDGDLERAGTERTSSAGVVDELIS